MTIVGKEVTFTYYLIYDMNHIPNNGTLINVNGFFLTHYIL